MKITVIDGQGGGVGRSIIEQLSKKVTDDDIYAIGTNSMATANMLKGGAKFGATGENSIIVACKDSDIIVGPIGIIIANSILGEITEKMSLAITESKARKILIPSSKCHIQIAGLSDKPMAKYIEDAVNIILDK